MLRLRTGEHVGASDGAGGWLLTRWTGKGLEPAASAESSPEQDPEPDPTVTIGLAVVKGDRFDWAVQKLTEVGVDRVVPLLTDHTVVKWDDSRARRAGDRWRKIAREAAMQSRRVRLPVVEDPLAFPKFVAGAGASAKPGITTGAGDGTRARDGTRAGAGPAAVLAEPGGPPLTLSTPTVLVGPEGGWSPSEVEAGLAPVGLGPGILRAETAAVAAGVLLASLRAGMVSPAPGTRP